MKPNLNTERCGKLESLPHFLSPEGNRVFIIVNLILFSSHFKPTIDVAKLLTGWKAEGVLKRWRQESAQKFQLVGELSEDNRTYRNNLLAVGSRNSSVSIINTLQAGRSRNCC